MECKKDQDEKWLELFNGKDLQGWKASEHDSSWSVVDGVLQGVGERSHLFYQGKYLQDTFKNFELVAEVKTHKLANSGIYFHTAFQQEGWPNQGIEVQVNNSHIGMGEGIELKKSGSLYGVRNIYQTFTKDSVWYTTRIIVQGKNVKIWIDSMLIVDYTKPEDPASHGIPASRQINKGTIALQCHDPLSKVHFRSIRIRRIPDDAPTPGTAGHFGSWFDSLSMLQGRQFAFIDLNPGGGITMDSLLACYYQTGINVAAVIPLEDTMNRVMQNKLNEASNIPVFKGLKVNESNYMDVSPDISAAFDYLIGESSDLLTSKKMLASGKIKIWAHQGEIENYIPYIRLAKQHQIAIEINNETKTPSLELIKMAKSEGCKFTLSHLVPPSRMEASTYIFDAIQFAGLGYKDFYIPKW
jgi:hypothetical protein